MTRTRPRRLQDPTRRRRSSSYSGGCLSYPITRWSEVLPDGIAAAVIVTTVRKRFEGPWSFGTSMKNGLKKLCLVNFLGGFCCDERASRPKEG